MRRTLLLVPALLIAGGLSACGGGSDDTSATTAASTAAAGPAITAFAVPTEIACRGTSAEAAVSWTTENADGVSFAVDGEPVPAGAGYPASGDGNVPVPCDDARHEITLTAGGDGSVSESAAVGTVVAPIARPRPAITRLSAPATQACEGDTADVTLLWATTGADSVAIAVDGQPLSADAGRALSGSAAVPVPCDDAEHRITLTASGAGTAAATHSVDVRTIPDPPADTPVITAMQAPAEVACTGGSAAVPVRWTTRNVESVGFAVDGQPVPAGAGYPTSGDGDVPVPCDGAGHEITLTGSGTDGDDISHTVTVHAVPRNAPTARPAITRLTMPTRVGCPAGETTAMVTVSWRTRHAESVQFALDGQPVPAQAGLPVNGSGNLPVPCDGDRHMFELIAESTGNSMATVKRPITAVPAAAGTATESGTSTAP